jgi:hypothetical protein
MTVSKQSEDGTAFHPDSAWKTDRFPSSRVNSLKITTIGI